MLRADFPLHRDIPALHRARVEVTRHVGDVRGQRIELRRIGQPRGIALLRGDERRRGRVRLVDDGVDHLGAVDRQQVAAAGAAEVHVAHAVAAAHDRVRRRRVRESEAGAEVIAIRIDERAVGERAAGCLDDSVRRGIVVRQDVVVLPVGRRVLVAQSEIQRQLAGSLSSRPAGRRTACFAADAPRARC